MRDDRRLDATKVVHRSRAAPWAVPAAIAVITFLAFLPALRAGFVSWDDERNFVTNPHYRGLGVAQLRWMWSTFLLGHYVPLSWMTLGLDYSVWGMNPQGYHLTSLLIHTANAVLLYYIALRVLGSAESAVGSALLGMEDVRRVAVAAGFSALFFAVHPLRVESVVWITERRDVLCGFFSLLCVLSYLRWATERRRRDYAIALAFFVCALLSKGTAVTVPIALLALDLYPLRRLSAGRLLSREATAVYLELIPFVLLSGAVSVLTLVALQQMTQLPPAGKIAVSAYSLTFYLWKTLVPSRLSPIYAMPDHVDPTATIYVVSYAVVLLITVVAIMLRKQRLAITVGWLAFVGVIFPMLGVHQNGPQIAADRYTYQAAPILALLAGGALLLGWRRSAATAAVAAVIIGVLGVLTWNQTYVWRDSTSLWSHVLALDSTSSYGHNNWGNLLLQQGKVDEAQTHYARAVALAPDYAQAHNNLGITLARQGRFDRAIPE